MLLLLALALSASPAPALDRDWRPLAPAEVALLRPFFKDAIRWSEVRVYHRKWWPLQPADVMMSPNGHVYIPEEHPFYRDDYSPAVFGRDSFLHEMVHVYQVHQGVPVIRRRAREGGVYKYRLVRGRPFEEYAVEQQANLLRDYMKARIEAREPAPGLEAALSRFLADPTYLGRLPDPLLR